MKRISTMLAIGLGCVAVVAAQTSTPQTTSSQQTSAKSNTITVTGCLQKGDQAGAVGTSGTAGTPTAGGATASRTQSEAGNSAQFILTNAKNDSSSESNRPAGATAGAASSAGTSATAGTSGTSTAHPSATAGSKYVLEPGSAQSELTTNVGKRVEVTGTIDNSMSSTSPSVSASATSPAGSASASAGTPQKIRVASVRVIGSDCSSEQ
jgi:hypothetical protein